MYLSTFTMSSNPKNLLLVGQYGTRSMRRYFIIHPGESQTDPSFYEITRKQLDSLNEYGKFPDATLRPIRVNEIGLDQKKLLRYQISNYDPYAKLNAKQFLSLATLNSYIRYSKSEAQISPQNSETSEVESTGQMLRESSTDSGVVQESPSTSNPVSDELRDADEPHESPFSGEPNTGESGGEPSLFPSGGAVPPETNSPKRHLNSAKNSSKTKTSRGRG